MFGLGTPELVVIMAIAFFVFGGKKLPEIGAGLGKGIRSFKHGLSEAEDAGKGIIDTANVPVIKDAVKIKENIDQVSKVGNILRK
jgi:sec-independent protein translocase protein TatA